MDFSINTYIYDNILNIQFDLYMLTFTDWIYFAIAFLPWKLAFVCTHTLSRAHIHSFSFSIFVVRVHLKLANRCLWSKGCTFIRYCIPIVWLQFKRIMFSFSQTYFLSLSCSLHLRMEAFLLANQGARVRTRSFSKIIYLIWFFIIRILYKLCSHSASAVTVWISSP